MTPSPWVFFLLAAAAFRCWWLLAHDVILDAPRYRIARRWPRAVLDFAECPFCLGFWVALAWWGAWLWLNEWAAAAAAPFALSAAVGIAGAVADKLTD